MEYIVHICNHYGNDREVCVEASSEEDAREQGKDHCGDGRYEKYEWVYGISAVRKFEITFKDFLGKGVVIKLASSAKAAQKMLEDAVGVQVLNIRELTA